MLDRLISGAGAVAYAADGWTRSANRRTNGRVLRGLPGSLVVAGILFLLAGLLILVGVEATDGPTPRAIGPSQVDAPGASAAQLGQRTFATVSGSLASTYVETYLDVNANGAQDPGEDGDAWYYWLVEPSVRTGLTVRSTRPPSAIFTADIRGVVVDDPEYVKEDVRFFADWTGQLGLKLDSTKVIDARGIQDGTAAPLDLDAALPVDGSAVEVKGSRLVDYLEVCTGQALGKTGCGGSGADAYDIVVYDPIGKHAVTVLTDASPEFTPTTMTGLVRRDERAVDEARTTDPAAFADLRLSVSDHYLLDDGTGPSSAPLAFGLAGVVGVIGGLILIGLAGGYLVYRRSDGHPAVPATSLTAGDRVPLRITGVVHTPTGRVRVREAPGELVRFVLGRPVAPPSTDPTTPIGPPAGVPIDTTLLVSRAGRPDGVDVGFGRLTRLSMGRVFPLGGARPAVRIVADTGPLLLSFDTEAERDRAAGQLFEESGLAPDGTDEQTV